MAGARDGGGRDGPAFADFEGRVRRRPVRAHEWTAAKREGFLNLLASHGCADEAAREVGMSVSSAFALRRRDPAFHEGWMDSIQQRRDALEALLWRKAMGRGGEEADKLDVATALQLIKQYDLTLSGTRRGGGFQPRTASAAELVAALKPLLAKARRRFGDGGAVKGEPE